MKLHPLPWFRVVNTIFPNPLALLGGVLLCFAPAIAPAQSVTFAGAQSVLPTTTTGQYGYAVVAVDSAGDVFATGWGDVLELPRTATGYGPQTVLPASDLSHPVGVAVDSAGDVFISDFNNNDVVELPWTGTGYGSQATLPFRGLENPTTVAVDSAGDLFVDDYGNNRAVELPKTATGYGRQVTLPFSGLSSLGSIAVDASKNVFLVDSVINGRVLELPWTGTSYGSQVTLPTNGLFDPWGVALDSAGDLFITDSGSGVELPKTATGYGPQTNLALGLFYPFGDAVDNIGDVFVVDENYTSTRLVELQTLSVDFGGANVCAPGATTPAPCSQTLTLTYNVNADVTLGSPLVLTGGAPNLDFTLANGLGSTCTGAVTAGSICFVQPLTFAPLAAGFRHGSVIITDGGGHGIATVELSGFGIAATTGAPVAQLSTTHMSFGAIDFGTTKTFPLFVANIGGGTLTVAPSISGPSYKIADSTCSAGVTPGNSCTLVVEYAPVSIGPHDDTLTVATNGGNPTVGLFGPVAGLSVLGGVSGATLEFGTVSSGSTKVELLTVTNVGLPGTVTVGTAISGLTFSILTTAQNTCMAGIAAGQSCTLPVQFAPTHSGPHDEPLTLTPFPGAGNTKVWLTGSTP